MLEKETREVFRGVVILSLAHKEFGLNPKMDRKPLKDFEGGRYDQVCFFKVHSGCSAAWGHWAGQEVSSSESKEIIRRSWLYSRPVAAVEMVTIHCRRRMVRTYSC